MNSVLTTALLGLFVTVVAGTDPLVVTTTLGKVRGQLAKTRGGRQYTQFLGIPYAKSPTGSLRFKVILSRSTYAVFMWMLEEFGEQVSFGDNLKGNTRWLGLRSLQTY